MSTCKLHHHRQLLLHGQSLALVVVVAVALELVVEGLLGFPVHTKLLQQPLPAHRHAQPAPGSMPHMCAVGLP